MSAWSGETRFSRIVFPSKLPLLQCGSLYIFVKRRAGLTVDLHDSLGVGKQCSFQRGVLYTYHGPLQGDASLFCVDVAILRVRGFDRHDLVSLFLRTFHFKQRFLFHLLVQPVRRRLIMTIVTATPLSRERGRRAPRGGYRLLCFA